MMCSGDFRASSTPRRTAATASSSSPSASDPADPEARHRPTTLWASDIWAASPMPRSSANSMAPLAMR